MSNISAPSSLGTALVTGASSGIGATYADRLARRGYDVILVARDKARLEKLSAELQAATGRRVEALPADLTDRSDLARVESRIRGDASLCLVVNNAGLGPEGPMAGADIDYLDKMIQLNVTALNRLSIAATDAFTARNQGTIINIASVVALAPELFNGSYSGSKAYVLAFTQSLQAELEKAGSAVRVQAVLPGLTRTEIFERAGLDIGRFDPAMVMEVGDMVEAALAGLDLGEKITIPSLPESAEWDRASAARQALGPHLSLNRPAARYGVAA